MNAARQQFEKGAMFWFDYAGGVIFAIADDGWWGAYVDTWDGQTEPPDEPVIGKIKPLHGFGHIWTIHEVKDLLGWATANEEAGQGECDDMGEDGWHLAFSDDYSATLEYPTDGLEPEPTPDPEPPPPPPPPPEPGVLLPLHEQANYHMVLLPSAEAPLVMWNLESFLYMNLLSDGRVVGELKRPIVGIELPPGVEIDERDGRWIVWFAGEYAQGLWAHCLRVAYRPFIGCVDGWPGSD